MINRILLRELMTNWRKNHWFLIHQQMFGKQKTIFSFLRRRVAWSVWVLWSGDISIYYFFLLTWSGQYEFCEQVIFVFLDILASLELGDPVWVNLILAMPGFWEHLEPQPLPNKESDLLRNIVEKIKKSSWTIIVQQCARNVAKLEGGNLWTILTTLVKEIYF